MSSESRRDKIGLCVIGLVLLVSFAPVVVFRESLLASPIVSGVLPEGPYGYDGQRGSSRHMIDPGASAWQGEPWIKLAGSQIREGHVPLWNPYNGFGAPLAANMQSGVFFPLQWVLFFSSDPWTWNLFLLLRLFVVGAFTYLYLRLLRLSVLPAMAGAIAAMLSGHFVLYVNMMHLNVEILLPLVVYLTERLIRHRTLGSMMLLGAALALTILGGMPESTLFLWVFVGLYYVVRMAEIGSRRRRLFSTVLRLTPLMVAAVFVAVGLSAVLLVPFLDYLLNAWTAHGTHYGMTGNAPGTAIALVLPHFFNNLRRPWGLPSAHDVLPYIGIIPILLAVLSFPARGRLRAIALLCSGYAIVSVLKAHMFPVVNWIGLIPPFDRAVFPKYNQPEVSFAVAVLAGIGAQNMLRAGMRVSSRRVLLASAILAFAMLAFLDTWWSTIVGANAVWWVATQTALGALILVVGAVLLCCVRVVEPTRRPLILGAVVLVLGMEMYLYIPKDRPWKHEAASTPPFVEFLRTRCPPGECRVYGLDSVLYPNWSAAFRLADVRTLDAMYVDRVLKFSNIFFGNKEGDRFTGSASREFKPNNFPGFSNVRYLLTKGEIWDTDFIDDVLRNGERRAGDPSFVSKTWWVIGGAAKPVLFEHPPTEITYRLVVPTQGAVLRFSLGMDPDAWSPLKGDGMEFEIEVVSEGHTVSLFRRYYDPKNRDADRRWVDGEVDLFAFRGRPILLRLITRIGKDGGSDWGGWGDLRLVPAVSDPGQQKWPTLVYDREIKIYENLSVTSRAFVVHRAEIINDEKSIVGRLLSPSFHPRRLVILEGKVRSKSLKVLGSGPSEGAVARIVKYLPDRVEMTVDAARPGVLVFLDSYYPGWRATVNGKSARIYRANYLFRGVFVQAGKNEVKFDYSPWSFWVGLWMTLGTVIVMGTAVVLSRLRQRRSSRHP